MSKVEKLYNRLIKEYRADKLLSVDKLLELYNTANSIIEDSFIEYNIDNTITEEKMEIYTANAYDILANIADRLGHSKLAKYYSAISFEYECRGYEREHKLLSSAI